MSCSWDKGPSVTLWIITATRGQREKEREREREKERGGQKERERGRTKPGWLQYVPHLPPLPSPPPAHVTAISLNGALCKMEMILASGVVIGRIAG